MEMAETKAGEAANKPKGGTSKKVKVVGTQTYINAQTGETEQFQVVSIEDRDAHFEKLWLGHILEAIDEIGNAKMRILTYLLKERHPATNQIIKTQREIAQETGISRATITDTLKALELHDIIRRKTGVLFLNPNVVFKGGHNSRMKVLLEYKHQGEQADLFAEEQAEKISPISAKKEAA
jgi:DNA-binding Lrp family transcriptional regulator